MSAVSILGIWLFTGLVYHQQPLPPLNPNLKIYFNFEDSGVNTLYYKRDGELGFCERRAEYKFKENTLYQKVIWVNPANAEYCGTDVDMRMGVEGTTPAWIDQNKLYLKFQMGEDDLTYVWDKTELPYLKN